MLEYTDRAKRYVLTPSRKHAGRAVARRSKSSLVAEVLKDPVTRQYVIKRIGNFARRELSLMCAENSGSVLGSKHVNDLKEFTWEKLLVELDSKTPVLLSIIQTCTQTRRTRCNRSAVIGMCFAILLRHHHLKMCLVQKVVSMILYAGDCSKQVYQRLQKLNICTAYETTNSLLNVIGSDHDSAVLKWRDSLIGELRGKEFEGTSSEHAETKLLDCYSSDSSSSDNATISSSSIEPPNYSPLSSHLSSDTESAESKQDTLILVSQNRPTAQDVQEACIDQVRNTLVSGFKLVGDNVDIGIKARYIRSDQYINQSLHYFHYFAVLNRIDFSDYEDSHPQSCLNSSPKRVLSILPSEKDDEAIQTSMATLVSRILVEHMQFFKHTFEDTIEWHIKHKHSIEMSSKSVVVPLGILPKNENKGDDMVDIMVALHEYVPALELGKSTHKTCIGDIEVTRFKLHGLLFGGDQLTCARGRSAKKCRKNSLSQPLRLDGLIPCAEDWHVKLNFLDVVWKYFFSSSSSGEHGTMYQLRNLIGRTNVSNDPIHKFNESDDFMKLITTAYILMAAMEVLKMDNLNDVPHVLEDPQNIWMETKETRKSELEEICKKVVKFVGFQYNASPSHSDDSVLEYSKTLLGLGCFYLEFSDAIKEGDGDRILRCWRYLLPIFKSSGRKNYSIEVFRMLWQFDYELTPRQAQELIWSRCVSTHDAPGKNIPCDLHLEHLNRTVKDGIRGLKSNKMDKTIMKLGKTLGMLSPLLDNFDLVNSVNKPSGQHNPPGFSKDLAQIIEHLKRYTVFSYHRGRAHQTYPKARNPLHALKKDTIIDWIIKHI